MAGPTNLPTMAADHDASFEELAAALAIGSIEPDDATLLRPHLTACARCRQLVDDYGAVVNLLPLSRPEAPASPELKSRLLAEAARQTPAVVVVERPAVAPAPSRGFFSRLRLAYALPLAAVLLVSLALLWWSLALQGQVQSLQARLERQDRYIAALASGGQKVALAGTDQAPGAFGEVVQPAGGGAPLLAVHGLPELPPERTYQVWVISGGQPAGAGLLRPAAGETAIVPLERDLAGAQTVALTVEPRGGSPGPTGPIVMAGNV